MAEGAIVAIVAIAAGVIIARHKYGRRRHWRISITMERDYEGPDRDR